MANQLRYNYNAILLLFIQTHLQHQTTTIVNSFSVWHWSHSFKMLTFSQKFRCKRNKNVVFKLETIDENFPLVSFIVFGNVDYEVLFDIIIFIVSSNQAAIELT